MILCPKKTVVIDPSKHQGYTYREEDGIAVFFEPEFEQKLADFLKDFTQFRESRSERVSAVTMYDQLPYVDTADIWKVRQFDLELIKNIIGSKKSCDVLDIGAWNGWLSQQLSNAGHAVTAIDYFSDEFDGLKAKKHYTDPQWTAIQMDLEKLETIEKKFDVVVLNRCIAYYTSFEKTIAAAKQLLKPNGQLIVTGISVFRNTKNIQQHFEKVRAEYLKQFGSPMEFKPFKGYLDDNDFATLKNLNLRVKKYPQHWKGNLAAVIQSTRPKHYYGVLTQSAK
jgi:2-polyprenyl-3-methyl-5-hydroxy-6-metoxy-1,4-benzoquinol methylase